MAKDMYIQSVLSAYHLGESVAEERTGKQDDEEDDLVRYYIYEFEMTPKMRRKLAQRCATLEMTPSEFLQAAVKSMIQWAEEDPEGYLKESQEWQQREEAEEEIKLIRFYPVHVGETEAQARKRKIAEEYEEQKKQDNP